MSRVKTGNRRRQRHKKVLELTKGHWGARHRVYRRAHESMIHALSYAYAHRRERKGDFRRLWIARINAAARLLGISYSKLIEGLTKANVAVDRKMLADMAVSDSPGFARMVALAREAS